jgi:hypothetical protein
MNATFLKHTAIAAIACISSATLPGLALAGDLTPVPVPLAGAGLPALAVAGGALWLVRKLSGRRS